MRTRAKPSIVQRLLFVALAPPCFVAGLLIGGCGFSARDDFLQIRSAQLIGVPGDRSPFAAGPDYPAVAGFAGGGISLTTVADRSDDP